MLTLLLQIQQKVLMLLFVREILPQDIIRIHMDLNIDQ